MPAILLKFSSSSKRFRDRKKERRIFEHLTNKNDVITDEDIRNVRIDIDVTTDEYVSDVDFIQQQAATAGSN